MAIDKGARIGRGSPVPDLFRVHEVFELSIAEQTVRGNANDKKIPLIAQTNVTGGVQGLNDIVIDYEGFILLDNTSTASGQAGNLGLELVLEFEYTLGGTLKIPTRRAFRERLLRGQEDTKGFTIFDRRIRVPLGTVDRGDGQQITITQEMLDGPIGVKLDLIVSLYDQNFTNKITNANRKIKISGEDLKLTFWQLQSGDALPPAIQPAARELVYGIYDDDDSAEVATQEGEVSFTRLPASVSFTSPRSTQGSGNQRWFLRVPPGVWVQHWHLGSIANDDDPGWRLDTSYTGAGRRYLSAHVGTDATTQTTTLIVDLVAGG